MQSPMTVKQSHLARIRATSAYARLRSLIRVFTLLSVLSVVIWMLAFWIEALTARKGGFALMLLSTCSCVVIVFGLLILNHAATMVVDWMDSTLDMHAQQSSLKGLATREKSAGETPDEARVDPS
jgi:hypothetical protein